MGKLTAISILMVVLSCLLYSQQEVQKERIHVTDSIKQNIDKLNNFKLRFHTFRQKYFSDELSINQPILPYSTWMLKSSFSKGNNAAPLMQQSDMLRTYKMLYGIDDEMKYLHMILGMAQTATVGVLAYKHIKKYGFLSK